MHFPENACAAEPDGNLDYVMDVARSMVLNVGLNGTSVEKVIEQAGVTRGTFFFEQPNATV